jgi:hypothetical protein
MLPDHIKVWHSNWMQQCLACGMPAAAVVHSCFLRNSNHFSKMQHYSCWHCTTALYYQNPAYNLPLLRCEHGMLRPHLCPLCALLTHQQVAGKVTKNSLPATPSSGILLLDPAAREQLQHQVLSNCNDKHAAVTAAFRVAAQAVAAAASSIAPGSHPSARAAAAAAAAVEVFGGTCSSSGNLSTLADAAGKVDAGMFADAAADPAPEAVAEALQQLRSSYHQELVAATSALFAICRGFGQTATVAAAASQPIKNALTAAQQQHVRVEQLWQDVLVAAAGNKE